MKLIRMKRMKIFSDNIRFNIYLFFSFFSFKIGALSISNGGAFLLVYSVNNEQSWNDIKDLRQQVCVLLDIIHNNPLEFIETSLTVSYFKRKCDKQIKQ